MQTYINQLGWNNHFQSQLTLDSLEAELPFRVTSVHRNRIACLGLDAHQQPKVLRLPTYTWRNEPPEGHPTVGDWLMLDHQLTPLYLLERKTLIKRRIAGRESLIQLIAANIDAVFIVTSCNDEFNLNRIERYLALAAESQIQPVIVLTKIDLCADDSAYVNAIDKDYPNLPVERVNATDANEIKTLDKWIGSGQTVALLGSSGVGKSTIINRLIGNDEQATGAIRESDSKGRHTTTVRSLHLLDGGGVLLDTPGIRELQLVDSEEGIHATFSDINKLAAQCRFSDCRHKGEPGCAVIREIKEGRLEQRRLDNYQKLMAEQTRSSESLAERRVNERALGRFYKHTLQSARRFKSRD
ncbi:MAG: ribosome small subunit-dependent GTPase A [Gammaproteobacteria bacterium]|nr:ribosome small subunit-dependent GTPase A [Gammaproteobacteria bacterium]